MRAKTVFSENYRANKVRLHQRFIYFVSLLQPMAAWQSQKSERAAVSNQSANIIRNKCCWHFLGDAHTQIHTLFDNAHPVVLINSQCQIDERWLFIHTTIKSELNTLPIYTNMRVSVFIERESILQMSKYLASESIENRDRERKKLLRFSHYLHFIRPSHSRWWHVCHATNFWEGEEVKMIRNESKTKLRWVESEKKEQK